MSIQKLLKFDISNITRFFSDGSKSVSNGNCTTPEELQGMLNNDKNSRPLVDTAERYSSVNRMEQPEVKAAVKKFNSLTPEEREKIMDLADGKLHEKMLLFIENNTEYENTSKDTMEIFNKLSERISYIFTHDAYDDGEMDEFWDAFDNIIKQCKKSIDFVTDTFVKYRGYELLDDKDIPLTDKAKYATTKSSNMKQTVASYSKIVKSKLREMHRTTVGKEDLMQNIVSIIARLQTVMEIYQKDSTEIMNNYIAETISNENSFYTQIEYFANNGIEDNFSIENKVVENAMLDAIVETLHYRGTALN